MGGQGLQLIGYCCLQVCNIVQRPLVIKIYVHTKIVSLFYSHSLFELSFQLDGKSNHPREMSSDPSVLRTQIREQEDRIAALTKVTASALTTFH